jgi:riboflavin biosynthesis pyrimidine reductase
MRQLLPEYLEDVDTIATYEGDARPAPPDRPWLLTNMIASSDGAITVEGRSGSLGTEADKAVFSTLRSLADVVLVGAGTARTEGYGPPRTPETAQARRRARGQTPFPRLALVSGRLDLDFTAPLFTAAPERPLIITTEVAPPEQVAAAAEVADVIA